MEAIVTLLMNIFDDLWVAHLIMYALDKQIYREMRTYLFTHYREVYLSLAEAEERVDGSRAWARIELLTSICSCRICQR